MQTKIYSLEDLAKHLLYESSYKQPHEVRVGPKQHTDLTSRLDGKFRNDLIQLLRQTPKFKPFQKSRHILPICNFHPEKCEFQKRRSPGGNHLYSQPRCKWAGTCNQQKWMM